MWTLETFMSHLSRRIAPQSRRSTAPITPPAVPRILGADAQVGHGQPRDVQSQRSHGTRF